MLEGEMAIKYHVTLTDEERDSLKKLINKGRTAGYRIKHANILLALDENGGDKKWTDTKVAEAYHTTDVTVTAIRKRFVEGGLEAALERKKRETPPVVKIDGEKEARIIALACSDPPAGHAEWTLRLLAGKTVQLGIFDSISHTAIANCLKKTKSSRGRRRNGVFRARTKNM
jgi:hypothetical protein